jgi:hypothetical protein
MSDDLVSMIFVFVCWLVFCIFHKRARPPMVIVESFEFVRERPKSGFLANLIGLAVVGLIIWILAH